MFCQSALGLLSKLDIFVQYCDFVQCGMVCFVQNYYISYSFIVINILFREKDSIFPWIAAERVVAREFYLEKKTVSVHGQITNIKKL